MRRRWPWVLIISLFLFGCFSEETCDKEMLEKYPNSIILGNLNDEGVRYYVVDNEFLNVCGEKKRTYRLVKLEPQVEPQEETEDTQIPLRHKEETEESW